MKEEEDGSENGEEGEELSLADELGAAFDADSGEGELGSGDDGGSGESDTPGIANRERDASGKFVSKAKEPAAEEVDTNVEVQGKSEEAPPGEEIPAGDGDKAPAGWTPAAREEWAALPASIKSEISRREGEMTTGMQQAAERGKVGDQFMQVVAPFQSVMAAEGVNNPLQAVQNLMQMTATMRMGTPVQKAQLVQSLIETYGVDIGTLDGLLVGDVNSPEPSVADQIQQAMAPMMQQFNTQREQGQQADSQRVATELTAFAAGKEFIDDVRVDMADLLEMAGKRGQTMTLDDAYNRACAYNPQVAAVLSNRKLQADAAALAGKKAAASSITGAPNGATQSQAGNTMRGSIEEAWDARMEG